MAGRPLSCRGLQGHHEGMEPEDDPTGRADGPSARDAAPWVMECAAGARESFDRITRLLARVVNLPLATFSLPSDERQVIEGAFGLSTRSSPASEGAFFRACMAAGDLLAVPDAVADSRFRGNPLVATPPYIRFYAGVPVRAPDGTVVGILSVLDTQPHEFTPTMEAVLRDMRAIVEEMLLLLTMSAQDRLTRLLNRSYFEDMFNREWRRAQREGTELALVMIDVDHFKDYNDHFGHPVGDDCLKRVAATLDEQFRRPGDVVARYGGEEFAVILPRTGAPQAGRLAEGAAASLGALEIPHPRGLTGRVTISAGVAALRPMQRCDRYDLLKAADAALYAAKAAGRNNVRLA
jgi:diguanylate cyclase (GGDEF)-like protein